MAQCVIEGDQLVVQLSAMEKIEAVHGDVTVPLSSVRGVEVVENLLDYVHGWRAGTGVPGSVAVGTFTSRDAKIFAVIHHGQHRGVRLRLEGAHYDEILISSDDARSMAAAIPATS